ncbi:MAG TPA: hypothetical protein VLM11_02130 [Streptosporangiaceae bacterium]|nr:hypothetical protein [Streptosporangiaceae bacterium]
MLAWPRAGRLDAGQHCQGRVLAGRALYLVPALVALSVGPPKAQTADGRAILLVVEPDRLRLADLAQRTRTGRLHPIIGAVRPLAEAPSAFTPDRRVPGKTIIRATEGG